jgi:hypothetical protein
MTRVVNRRKDKYDVYVGRGSIFGNPFSIGVDGSRDVVCDKHLDWLYLWIEDKSEVIINGYSNKTVVENLNSLKGKTLGCYCKPQRCHADNFVYLLEESLL